jgi:hypothetical protein
MKSAPSTGAGRRRLVASVSVALTIVASSLGCSSPNGSELTPEEARDALYETLDETQVILGGTFDNQDDPTARGCALALWSEGDHFPALRLGAAPADATAAVDDVSDYWTELGYDLTTATVGAVVEVQGMSDLGATLILRVSTDATTLQGESACRPS